MLSYAEDLKFYKMEKIRIESEINDLEAEIIVAGGRGNRAEVNDYRRRVNSLKMKLNEISQKIHNLERNQGQIQVISPIVDIVPKSGMLTVTDDIEFDRGFVEEGVEIVETVSKTIERNVEYKNGMVVSQTETVTEKRTRKIIKNNNQNYIETVVVD